LVISKILYGREMLENTLWVEKYRPSTLDQYIGSDALKNTVNAYLKSHDIPHLLLYGAAGGGKTTLAKIIANTIASGNYLYINASDENSVDTVRDKIKQFASTIGFGGLKIVILDEADFTTANFQAALRNVMETFSKNTRFILTCNYKDKIIEPIHSRCQSFHILPPSKKDSALMVKNILDLEEIEYDNKTLASVINLAFPDIRKIINTLQQNSIGKRLTLIDTELVNNDLNNSILNLLLDSSINNNNEKFSQIRQLVADNLIRDFNPIYRFIYDSIDKFPNENRFSILATIADAQYKDAFVVDHEINAMNSFYTIITELK
jgi:DNA polymerase III delta prime subunit